MKNIWKRSLSMLLALVLVLGMVPVNILAAGSEGQTEDDIAAVLEGKFSVGESATIKGSDAAPSADNLADAGTHWEGPVESTGVTCGKDYEHTHTDACYTTPNVTACAHFLESTLLGHPDTCTVANLDDPCTSWICIKSHKTVNGTKYHVKFECQHTHSRNCYTLGCDYALKGEHTHSRPACYSYTWTVAKNQYNVNITVVGDASGIVAGSATTRVTHGDNVSFKMTGAGDDYTTWYAEIGGELIELPKTGEKEITVKAQPQNVAHDGTFNIEVKLSNKKAATYTITVVEENALEGCGYELSAKENLLAGAASQLKVTVPTNSDSVTFSPKITISGEGASYADGVITVGTGDVTVTVDYGAKKLSGKADGKIEYTADMSLEEIRQAVFSELAVEYFPGGVQWNTPGVKYEYKYWSTYTIYGGQVGETWQTDNYAEIGTDPADKDELVGYTTNHPFGYTGLGTVEHVKLSYNGVSIEADIKLTNYFTVAFVDENGNTLKSERLEYGEPIVAPADPTKADEVDENGNFIARYTFAGWSPALAETVTGNVTYKPNFTKNVAQYTITWSVNGNETTETYNYGEMPSFKGSTDKADKVDGNGTVIEKYIFTGWTSELAIVTGAATYTAVYDTEVQKYTVTFKDEDGTVLKSETLEYGAAIVAPADPTKADDQDANGNIMATYTFADWGSEVAATVTGDVTYTAIYTKTVAQYIVTVVVGDESTTYTYDYGYSLAQPANPTVPEGYGFECWEIDGKCAAFPLTVVKDVTLTAKFVNHAAMIGQTYYESLQAALNAAQPGDEIVLLKDALLSGKLTITKAVTINGNGFSIKADENAVWYTVSGKLNIKNYKTHLIGVNASGVTLKNVTLDCNNNAAGINIYCAQDVIFDSVSIINATKGTAALTVNGSTLTIMGSFDALGNAFAMDVSNCSGVTSALGVTIVDGTVVNTGDKTVKFASVASMDVTGAVDADGNPYFVAMDNAYFFTQGQMESRTTGYSNGLTLLADVNLNNNLVVSGTLNLNGHTLNIAEGKALKVSGKLKIAGEGTINGDVLLMNDSAVITAPVGMTVGNGKGDGYNAIYVDGQYRLGSVVTFVYGNGQADDVAALPAGAVITAMEDPTWKGHLFAGWDPELVLPLTPMGNVTYTAKWDADADEDGVADGTEADPYWTVIIDGETVSTTILNGAFADPADPADRDYMFFVEWNKVVDNEEHTITYTSVWNNNDSNNNNVDDAQETITITVNKADDADEVVITGAVLIDGNYIYDSTGNKIITIKATPVVNNGKSATFVSGIDAANGTGTYDASFAYTYTFNAVNGDTVTVNFAKAEFVFNEERLMNYYAGMKNVAQKELYDIIASAPAYDDADEVTITYKAREAMTHKVALDILKNGNLLVDGAIDLLKGVNIDGVVEDGYVLINMEALWLPVDVENKDPFPDSVPLEDAVDNFLETHDFGALIRSLIGKITAGKWNEIGTAISEFFAPVYESAKYFDAHRFGNNLFGAETVTEQIKLTYRTDALYIEGETTVDLKDTRKVTTIVGNNITVAYRDYTDEELFALVAPVVTDENGNVVAGATITCTGIADPYTYEGKVVSDNAYELIFKFAGNDECRPSEGVFTVTVTKAPITKFDVPNVNITYGDTYTLDPNVVLGNAYGEIAEVVDSRIQFIVGLDLAELDIDQDGVTGLKGKIQLIMSKDLQELLDTAMSLAGKDSINGVEMSLSELMEYLSILEDSSIDAIKQALDAISGIVETGDLTITLGGSYPTATGAYLYGAVTTNPNYETAFDVGYIIIKPNAQKVYLDFNYKDANSVFTWELLKYIDLNTSAFDDEALTVKNDAATALVQNLFFGIDEKGELVATLDGTSLGNGAYTQLSFIAEFGNEFYYAVPVVRAFVIVPNLLDVQIVDGQGNAQDEFNYVFDNTGKTHFVTVDGQRVEAQIHYVGLQTNTNTYNSTVAPKHAGAYVAYVMYAAYNDAGELTGAGFDTAAVVIKPADSTISVTGGTVDYDGMEHSVIVDAQGADVTLISGTANLTGEVTQIGLEAITGNVNVDFPKWLDQILSVQFADAYANGVAADDLIYKLQQHQAALVELGLSEDMIGDVIAVLEEIPATVTVTFNDGVTYTAPGVYVFMGVVTDSDRIPSADTGLLVIRKEYMDFELQDTTVTQNGKEHFADLVNPENSDYVAVIIDQENNLGNIILEEDMNALVAALEQALGYELPKTIDVTSIYAAIDKILSGIEGIEKLPVNAVETLQQIRAVLDKLPHTGTVSINGALPTEVGTYEIYAITYSAQYQTATTDAVLEIVPVQVKIEIEDASKYYGQDDPHVGYTVKYYDHLGNELADAGIVSVELNRAPGQNVGKYGITATVTNADEKNYEIVALTEDAVLEIKPAEITITVDNKGKVYGQKDPALTYNAAVSEGKGVIGSDLAITLDRVDGEDVGTYAITATVAENANYKIVSNVDGLFTIEAKEITLADVVLNGTLTYNGTEQTQGVTVTDGITYQVSGNTGTNAGDYTLTVTGNGNYTGQVKLPWSIEKAQVQITLEDVIIDVDDRIPQLNYTVTDLKGAVPGELLNLQVSVDVAKNAAGQNIVGTYQIKAEYAESENWTVSVVDANLTVELGDYVCWNMQTGTYYDDLSDALMAAVSGQTVQMLVEETAEDLLLVNAGITLDLNGSLVKAGNVLSFGQIKDSAENVGGLVISNNAQEAFTVLQKNNAYMPLYDVDGGCYRFFVYEFRYHAKRTGEGFITYAYTIDFENAAGYELLAAYGTDTGICFRHYLHWDNLNDNEMVFEYSSDVIKRFGQNALSVIENGSGVAVLTFKVSGLSVISGQELDSRMEASSATNVSQGDSAPSYDVP